MAEHKSMSGGSSVKGLKRHGMREWIVTGPGGTFIIRRERPRLYLLRAAHMPPQFFNQEFTHLRDARREAEDWAGVS